MLLRILGYARYDEAIEIVKRVTADNQDMEKEIEMYKLNEEKMILQLQEFELMLSIYRSEENLSSIRRQMNRFNEATSTSNEMVNTKESF